MLAHVNPSHSCEKYTGLNDCLSVKISNLFFPYKGSSVYHLVWSGVRFMYMVPINFIQVCWLCQQL